MDSFTLFSFEVSSTLAEKEGTVTIQRQYPKITSHLLNSDEIEKFSMKRLVFDPENCESFNIHVYHQAYQIVL